MQVILTAIGNQGIATLSLRLANTFWLGMRGLLGHPSPKSGEGLLITRCKSIHTIGMAYPIDVLYLDADMRIVSVAHSVQPRRVWVPSPPRRAGVTQVVEIADREAKRLGLEPGMHLHTEQPTAHVPAMRPQVTNTHVV